MGQVIPKQPKRRRTLLWLILGVSVVAGIFMLVANLMVIHNRSAVYSDIDLLPEHDVGLLLGTSVKMPNGNQNWYCAYRIDAAVALYGAGKIKHILVSGDNHVASYDEPTDSLVNLFTGFGDLPGRETSINYGYPMRVRGFDATLAWARRELPKARTALLTPYDPLLREFPLVDVRTLQPGKSSSFIALTKAGPSDPWYTRADTWKARRQRRADEQKATDSTEPRPIEQLSPALRRFIAIAPKGCWIWMAPRATAGMDVPIGKDDTKLLID